MDDYMYAGIRAVKRLAQIIVNREDGCGLCALPRLQGTMSSSTPRDGERQGGSQTFGEGLRHPPAGWECPEYGRQGVLVSMNRSRNVLIR
jgi:hypothetical protein